MKHMLTRLVIGASLLATPAFAEDGNMRDHKAKWESLSVTEKVAIIEEKRKKRISEMNKKWESMSDAEKVKFAEEKRKNHHKGNKMKDKRKERRENQSSDAE